jgi:hypothetical protein
LEDAAEKQLGRCDCGVDRIRNQIVQKVIARTVKSDGTHWRMQQYKYAQIANAPPQRPEVRVVKVAPVETAAASQHQDDQTPHRVPQPCL